MKEVKKCPLDADMATTLMAMNEESYAARASSEDEGASAARGDSSKLEDKTGWIVYNCPCKDALRGFSQAEDCRDCNHKLVSWRSAEACAAKAWMHLWRKEAHEKLKEHMEEEGCDDIALAFVQNLKVVQFVASASDRSWFWWQLEKKRNANRKKRKRARGSGEVQLFCAKTECVQFLSWQLGDVTNCQPLILLLKLRAHHAAISRARFELARATRQHEHCEHDGGVLPVAQRKHGGRVGFRNYIVQRPGFAMI